MSDGADSMIVVLMLSEVFNFQSGTHHHCFLVIANNSLGSVQRLPCLLSPSKAEASATQALSLTGSSGSLSKRLLEYDWESRLRTKSGPLAYVNRAIPTSVRLGVGRR